MESTKIINEQAPEQAARVIRNLAQIEADFFYAAGPLGEQMMSAAFLAIEKVVEDPWLLIENEGAAQIVANDWRMTRAVGNTIGDMWLQISEISADEEGIEHTWVAAVTRTVPSMLCVELVFRRGLQDHAQALIRDDKIVAPLWGKDGFGRNEDTATLLIPIVIQAEALAKGFLDSNLAPAVAPFANAVRRAMALKPALDALLEQVRAAAKRK